MSAATGPGGERPPFRADHVGSLLRPARLHEARERRRRGELDAATLEAVEDECIVEAVRMQEDVGLRGVTDGDFRRGDWIMDFVLAFEGLEPGDERYEVPFSGNVTYSAPRARMTGPLRCPAGGIMIEAFEFLARTTARTAKVCIPAPAMFLNVVGAGVIDRGVYPDPEEFWSDVGRAYSHAVAAFAAAGCTYLQIDDVHSATLADPDRQAFWREQGFDPAERLRTAIRLNNSALASRPESLTAAVHMCRGNFQSQWSTQGGYDAVAETYFSQMDVDAFFLEYDDARSGGFEPLRHVPDGKHVVLGLMTSKRPALEPEDELMRRVEEASRFVPLERLAISPQCGFASTHEGNRLTEDDQRRKLERLVQVAERVWGEI